MKRYDERMLELLLDRYESSLLFEGRNSRTIRIAQKITRTEFQEYYDAASIEYEEMHQQLRELEAKGLVTLVWKGRREGHILEKCILQDERIGEAYALLRRQPREEKRREILEILERYEGELPAFTACMKTMLEEGRSIRRYVDEDEPQELERVMHLAAAMLSNEKEQYLRSFSIRVFHDSKMAEKELHLACSILTRFERPDLPRELETDEILEECNIYRNPTFLFIKGMPIRESGGNENLQQGIGVFQADLPIVRERLAAAKERPDVILTIENLTSYHRWRVEEHRIGSREMVLYLAGYANRVKRSFLTELHQLFPEAVFCHFGDIDCGGFRIWKNLCLSTGIPIRTYGMGLAVWQQHRENGRPLTAADRKTLQKMLEDDFYAEQHTLFAKMLEENCKLEQEGND